MKIFVYTAAALLALLLVTGTLQARVVHQGVLDAVSSERKTVVIDGQEYKLAASAQINHQSEPELPLRIIDLRIGQRVVFDLTFQPAALRPEISVIVVQGRQ